MIILMKRKIDLITAMRTFLTVVENNSFSAAANQLNLVNSAVSRQVSDLERHYDCQLLYRTTRSMHLTNEGYFYLAKFKDLLAQLDSLEAASLERQQKIAGHLHITTPMNANELGLHLLFADFTHINPKVKISLSMLNRFVDLVDEGIDLAVRVGELEDSSLIARHFGDLHVLFVANPTYLAKYGVPTQPKELQHHHCLIDSSTDRKGRWPYREGNRIRKITVDGPIDLNSGTLIADLAANGYGIALLPNFLVNAHLKSGKLVPILEDYQLPSSPISLVYHVNRLTNPALKSLVEYLLDNKPSFDLRYN